MISKIVEMKLSFGNGFYEQILGAIGLRTKTNICIEK